MFHVPEAARLTTHPVLASTSADGNNGAFVLESPEPGWQLWMICSDGSQQTVRRDYQWEHVSVHAYRPGDQRMRVPTWKEMAFVKRTCWDGEDVVMQLHPRESEYVNNHPHVLHLWRPKHATIPTPPSELVGTR